MNNIQNIVDLPGHDAGVGNLETSSVLDISAVQAVSAAGREALQNANALEEAGSKCGVCYMLKKIKPVHEACWGGNDYKICTDCFQNCLNANHKCPFCYKQIRAAAPAAVDGQEPSAWGEVLNISGRAGDPISLDIMVDALRALVVRNHLEDRDNIRRFLTNNPELSLAQRGHIMFWANNYNRPEIFRMALDLGPIQEERRGHIALAAAYFGHLAIINALLGSIPPLSEETRFYMLRHAIHCGHIQIIEVLRETGFSWASRASLAIIALAYLRPALAWRLLTR